MLVAVAILILSLLSSGPTVKGLRPSAPLE
jgi:hypothetical protein